MGDAVAQPQEAWAVEGGAGDHQQVMLQLGPLGEGHIVAVRDPDEEIEGALRRDALVAHLGQLPIEQAAVSIIGRQVRPGIGAPLEF